MATPTLSLDLAREQLRALGLYGLAAQVHTLLHEPWLAQILELEQLERHRRSLKRRMDDARLGAFKLMTDFDWDWPTQCDRAQLQELQSLEFLSDTANAVIIGPNGLGKTMIAKNLVHQAVLAGHSARFVLASDMLHDLAAQDSSISLQRRLRRYTGPALLAIDELGYLSYDSRYADLLFEVITRRYQNRSIIITTNKLFTEWNQVFPNSACVVTLVDRLIHRAEIVTLEGRSYRLKEAEDRKALKLKSRSTAQKIKQASSTHGT